MLTRLSAISASVSPSPQAISKLLGSNDNQSLRRPAFFLLRSYIKWSLFLLIAEATFF